jgi:hypothetical protein
MGSQDTLLPQAGVKPQAKRLNCCLLRGTNSNRMPAQTLPHHAKPSPSTQDIFFKNTPKLTCQAPPRQKSPKHPINTGDFSLQPLA